MAQRMPTAITSVEAFANLNRQLPAMEPSGMATSPSLKPLLLALLLLALFSPAAVLASGNGGEKRTRIRVYVHEQFSGPNATVGSVAPSLRRGDKNSTFGEVGVVDDVLRTGPEASSEEVGRYQGLFAGADLADDNYFSAITLVFAAGEHNGSTLSLQGSYSFPDDGAALERAVVGGTGGFRLARGFSLLKVVSNLPEVAVFQLDLLVFTPRRRRY